MTRIDEIIANALAGIPETDAAILAREVVRLRGATSVVVPEYPENDFAIRESIRNAGGDPDFDQCIHRVPSTFDRELFGHGIPPCLDGR